MNQLKKSTNRLISPHHKVSIQNNNLFVKLSKVMKIKISTMALHVLDHLLSHWLNVGRTLTQSNRRSIFEWQQQNSANRKDSDPHQDAHTLRRSTAELTTNMKRAVHAHEYVLCSNKTNRISKVKKLPVCCTWSQS